MVAKLITTDTLVQFCQGCRERLPLFEYNFYSGFTLKKALAPVAGTAGENTASTDDTAFSGAIRKLRAREIMAGGKPTTLATHRIYSAVSVDIEEEDIITYDGKTFHVIVSDDVMQQGELRQTDVEYRA